MLSIIVPIYKIEEFLPQCIESILSQSYMDYELILVDDGSPDNCPGICDKYAQKNNRITVIHKDNGGLVSARKAGLQAARGEYIGYVDGDDWVDPGFYEKLMQKAIEYDADIVASGFIKDIGDNCTQKHNSLSSGFYSDLDIQGKVVPNMMFSFETFEPGLFTYVWNKVFKRSVLYDAQMNVPDSISLGEDAACVYPAVLRAKSLFITDDCLYHYRQRADSMLKISESYREDYARYHRLYHYLRVLLQDYLILKNEFDRFILYLITTRCGGVMDENGGLDFYLYDDHPTGRRLAIYGAGTLGQHLYKRIAANGYYNIVIWIDEDYQILKTHGLQVDSPDRISEINYDHVIIAFLDDHIVREVKQELVDRGISSEKIISADFLSVDPQNVLATLGVI